MKSNILSFLPNFNYKELKSLLAAEREAIEKINQDKKENRAI